MVIYCTDIYQLLPIFLFLSLSYFISLFSYFTLSTIESIDRSILTGVNFHGPLRTQQEHTLGNLEYSVQALCPLFFVSLCFWSYLKKVLLDNYNTRWPVMKFALLIVLLSAVFISSVVAVDSEIEIRRARVKTRDLERPYELTFDLIIKERDLVNKYRCAYDLTRRTGTIVSYFLFLFLCFLEHGAFLFSCPPTSKRYWDSRNIRVKTITMKKIISHTYTKKKKGKKKESSLVD